MFILSARDCSAPLFQRRRAGSVRIDQQMIILASTCAIFAADSHRRNPLAPMGLSRPRRSPLPHRRPIQHFARRNARVLLHPPVRCVLGLLHAVSAVRELNRHLTTRGLRPVSAGGVLTCQIASAVTSLLLPGLMPVLYAVSMWQIQSGVNRLASK